MVAPWWEAAVAGCGSAGEAVAGGGAPPRAPLRRICGAVWRGRCEGDTERGSAWP